MPPVELRIRLPDDVDTVLAFTVTLSKLVKPVTLKVPATFVLSKFVVPSTSKSPFASIAPVNVETPATLKLSKFV